MSESATPPTATHIHSCIELDDLRKDKVKSFLIIIYLSNYEVLVCVCVCVCITASKGEQHT